MQSQDVCAPQAPCHERWVRNSACGSGALHVRCSVEHDHARSATASVVKPKSGCEDLLRCCLSKTREPREAWRTADHQARLDGDLLGCQAGRRISSSTSQLIDQRKGSPWNTYARATGTCESVRPA